jgi:hypothetical protein
VPPSAVTKIAVASGLAAAVFGLVGASAHVGRYVALGFFDAKLAQALRAGEEFIPDGMAAILGGFAAVAETAFTHELLSAAILAAGIGAILGLRRERFHAWTLPVALTIFGVLALLAAPALLFRDMLITPPDLTTPGSAFANAVVAPLARGVVYSRITDGTNSWSGIRIRSSTLTLRYAELTALLLMLIAIWRAAPAPAATTRNIVQGLVYAGVILLGYFFGALQYTTQFQPTVALTGHARHPQHLAYIISTVGTTQSVFSFQYGNEEIDAKSSESDQERRDDILALRLNQR